MSGKLKRITISGLRTLDDFTLDLDGLTVLIGENGSGKSSVVEAFELLRLAQTGDLPRDITTIHGGERMLFRQGVDTLRLRVQTETSGGEAEYEVAIHREGSFEELVQLPAHGTTPARRILRRTDSTGKGFLLGATLDAIAVDSQFTIINVVGIIADAPLARELAKSLRDIDCQLPFYTRAAWISRDQGQPITPMRDSVTIAPATRLERFGGNLPNAYHALKTSFGDEEWNYTLDLVRLGLGLWVESVETPADPVAGRIALAIKSRNSEQLIPAAALSDGQLAYLAFVALARLPSSRSILVFDELELHLHPHFLSRVMDLIEEISKTTPVVLTTHSRQLLDFLSDPGKSVRVLELDPDSLKTSVLQLDQDQLNVWLESYEGLGRLLDAGYQESFLVKRPVGEPGC